MSDFVVQGPKSDYRDSLGLKNRLYPKGYNAGLYLETATCTIFTQVTKCPQNFTQQMPIVISVVFLLQQHAQVDKDLLLSQRH